LQKFDLAPSFDAEGRCSIDQTECTMIDHPEQNSTPRSWLARTGIVLLNLLLPGLGLIRLGYYRFRRPVCELSCSYDRSPDVLLSISMTVYFHSTPCRLGRGAPHRASGLYRRHHPWLASQRDSHPPPAARWLWRWYGVLGLEVLVVSGALTVHRIQHAIAANFYIPTVAMTPTLAVHDRIIADYRHVEPHRAATW
jgi:hypothetical protein